MAKINHFLFLFIASIYFSDNKNILLHIKLIPCINKQLNTHSEGISKGTAPKYILTQSLIIEFVPYRVND